MQTHDSSIDPVLTQTRDNATQQKPGVLQGKVSLTLQTERAQLFVYGRRKTLGKPPIWGLLTFAEKIKTLWLASSQDDPFADWWLMKTDTLIKESKYCIQGSAKVLNELLDTQCVLQVDTAQSVSPLRIALRFSNPYPFRAAHLLAEYDQLMCLWMTVQHVGLLIDEKLEARLRATAKTLRAVFASPQGYQRLGVSRAMYQAGEGIADNARAVMGDVPDDILSELRTPNLRPKKFHASTVKDEPKKPKDDTLEHAIETRHQTPSKDGGINATKT